MQIKVFDDFLTKSYHEQILDMMSGDNFPWYYYDNISVEGSNNLNEYGFSHMFWEKETGQRNSTQSWFLKSALLQIMDVAGCNTIIRSRGDMTTHTGKKFTHHPHIDYNFPHTASIYYVNDSDGDTIFFNQRASNINEIKDYDLKEWAETSASLDAGDSIEVKRIFFESDPAIVKFFDPYAGTGTGMMNMMDTFGWGNYSPAINFMLMPISFDLQKIQAIELNDQIRKSQFSFELINNNLRIFPIPRKSGTLWFQYIKLSDRNNPKSTLPSGSYNVTNVSNVNYTNPNYNEINSIGRSWIFDYTLAVCKEVLGYIRGKYTTVPIPGAEATLNQSDLLSAATAEKDALVTRLREYFDETSRDKLLERKAAEAESLQKIEAAVPYPIYIG